MKYRDRYMFYKDRPEWKDVTPVPQDENGRNVVRIAYSPEFVDANDYLRAVLLKDERSERSLELTGTVLSLNPANYTVWEFRRRILTSLNSELMDELNFVGRLLDETSKNYQLWHHRQWIVSRLAECETASSPDPESPKRALNKWGLVELEFTQDVISDDSKNYHSWQHRRWAVDHFRMPAQGELFFTESLITKDVYNNSAWNHRFVTVTKDEGLTPSVLEREIQFVQKMIRLTPDNESAWNYLYGLLVPTPCALKANAQTKVSTTKLDVVDETQPMAHDLSQVRTVITLPASSASLRKMRTFAEELAREDKNAADSVALLGFLVEVYSDCIRVKLEEDSGKQNMKQNFIPGDQTSPTSNESVSDLVEMSASICERLSTELDRIRAKYWRYRSRQIEGMVAAADAADT